MKISSIIEYICNEYNVSSMDLLSGKRGRRSVAIPRHIAIYVLYTKTNMSMVEVGEKFNIKHTSVVNSLQRASEILGVHYKEVAKESITADKLFNDLCKDKESVQKMPKKVFWELDAREKIDWKGRTPKYKGKLVELE